MPRVLAGALACAWLIAAGCATVGRDFPMGHVSEIRIGETTQAEIRETFGAPWRVGEEDGKRTWTYGKYRYRLLGRPRTSDLVVRFDDGGVVASYSFSTTEHDEGKAD
ncbi:outer membrane protein assembly factor BamE [bacterium]|nr:outer membrane protein assembly factor BamE [bacterium]MBU1073620.1 outer membrane protein assembly factor BamE [bacterium]MBU1676599.1 outer membrane protein assembly factor BamE [bacterium]